MPMPQQIANQGPIVTDFLRPFTVTDADGLDNAAVVAHHVYQTDKSIVQDRRIFSSAAILPERFAQVSD